MESLNTALINAFENGKFMLVKRLIERGADIDVVINLDGYTLLHKAVQDNYVDGIRILVEHGANIESSAAGQMPLHIAAKKNHLECIKVLIELGADVGAKDYMEKTPIERAIEQGHEQAASMMQHYKMSREEQSALDDAVISEGQRCEGLSF